MVRQGLICDVAVFVTHTLVPPRRSVNEPGTITRPGRSCSGVPVRRRHGTPATCWQWLYQRLDTISRFEAVLAWCCFFLTGANVGEGVKEISRKILVNKNTKNYQLLYSIPHRRM